MQIFPLILTVHCKISKKNQGKFFQGKVFLEKWKITLEVVCHLLTKTICDDIKDAMQVQIRSARQEDAKDILSIYAPYITNTAISFETEVPSLQQFQNRVNEIKKKFPYLVATQEEKIVGYAYCTYFKKRAAYDISCETSIYLARHFLHRGIGSALYTELEKQMAQIGIQTTYACIAKSPRQKDEYCNETSILFHKKLGYSLCGTFTCCAKKFGLFYDMVYMQKHLH